MSKSTVKGKLNRLNELNGLNGLSRKGPLEDFPGQTYLNPLIIRRDVINTVALARWNNAIKGEFSRFNGLFRIKKPLKRLNSLAASLHRAKATVLMTNLDASALENFFADGEYFGRLVFKNDPQIRVRIMAPRKSEGLS